MTILQVEDVENVVMDKIHNGLLEELKHLFLCCAMFGSSVQGRGWGCGGGEKFAWLTCDWSSVLIFFVMTILRTFSLARGAEAADLFGRNGPSVD